MSRAVPDYRRGSRNQLPKMLADKTTDPTQANSEAQMRAVGPNDLTTPTVGSYAVS